MKLVGILLGTLLLFLPLNALGFSDPEDPYESTIRGNNGPINSMCDNLSYHADAAINSEYPTPIKIEIINPDGKVVGVYEDTMRGSLDVDIDVDYDEEGRYEVFFHYKGQYFKVQDVSYFKDKIPSHEVQIQCLVTKAINSEDYHEYYSLSVRTEYYQTTWKENKDSLENILGDKFIEYYEPILNIGAIMENPQLFSQRMSTDPAFLELDKLHVILNEYAHEKTSLNYEIAENQIKQMNISDEDKVDVIYESRLNYDTTVKFFENHNKRFIDQVKGMYLTLDEIDEAIKLQEERELEQKILEEASEKEELESKQKILEELQQDMICGKGTILKDGFCVPDLPDTTPSSKGGGCLIATATFGSELAPQVQQLREIRDNSLLQTDSGRSFMAGFNQFYYSFSPTIADLERQHPIFKETVKLAITPLLTTLSILNYVDIDSEAEVLGYGISLILLNVGMYFVLPAIVIHRVRKYV